MNIIEATKSYEAWLAKQTPLVAGHLKLKHQAMRSGAFPFLRATYYRWAQILPKVCPDSTRAPEVLAVGDLHVENFGTWRDVDGRLVWGVNDFDECHRLPCVHDLIRLAASVYVAIAEARMAVSAKAASGALLEGYIAGLKAGGRPFVLADTRTPLRRMARDRLNTPERFWDKMHAFRPLQRPVPPLVKKVISEILPDRNVALQFTTALRDWAAWARRDSPPSERGRADKSRAKPRP